MSEQENKPDAPKEVEKKSKKKKKRSLRDESLQKKLDSDDIGEVLNSGKGETVQQAAKKFKQKDGQ